MEFGYGNLKPKRTNAVEVGPERISFDAGLTAIKLSLLTIIAFIVFVAANIQKYEEPPSVSTIIAANNVNTAIYLLGVFMHATNCMIIYFMASFDDDEHRISGSRLWILGTLVVYFMLLYSIAIFPVDTEQTLHRIFASTLFVVAIILFTLMRYLTSGGVFSRVRRDGKIGVFLLALDAFVLVVMVATMIGFGLSIKYSSDEAEGGYGAIYEYIFLGTLLFDRAAVSIAFTVDLAARPIELVIGMAK